MKEKVLVMYKNGNALMLIVAESVKRAVRLEPTCDGFAIRCLGHPGDARNFGLERKERLAPLEASLEESHVAGYITPALKA